VETAQVVQNFAKVENMKKLVPKIINKKGGEVAVNYNLQMTLVDGKIWNILSGTNIVLQYMWKIWKRIKLCSEN